MKKGIFKAKVNVESQKKLYVFLIGLAFLALILGIIFIFLISEENLIQIKDNITVVFNDINSGNKFNMLCSSIINNFTYVLVIWILGISIVGLPLILLIYCFKFFLFGFSISSVVYTFKWSGLLRMFLHCFPHQLLFLIVMVLVTFYGSSFCIKLFNYLFLKKNINFKEVMRKYLKILLVSCVCCLFVSLYEIYISYYLLNLFN